MDRNCSELINLSTDLVSLVNVTMEKVSTDNIFLSNDNFKISFFELFKYFENFKKLFDIIALSSLYTYNTLESQLVKCEENLSDFTKSFNIINSDETLNTIPFIIKILTNLNDYVLKYSDHIKEMRRILQESIPSENRDKMPINELIVKNINFMDNNTRVTNKHTDLLNYIKILDVRTEIDNYQENSKTDLIKSAKVAADTKIEAIQKISEKCIFTNAEKLFTLIKDGLNAYAKLDVILNSVSEFSFTCGYDKFRFVKANFKENINKEVLFKTYGIINLDKVKKINDNQKWTIYMNGTQQIIKNDE